MSYCVWDCLSRGGKCTQCGYVLRRDYATAPKRNCRAPDTTFEVCPHLGDPTGDTVKLFGCGCPSSRSLGIDTAVFECDLFGRCVTFPKGTHLADVAIKRCAACERNPNHKSPN